jgi:hypothetical protein
MQGQRLPEFEKPKGSVWGEEMANTRHPLQVLTAGEGAMRHAAA